MEKEAQIQKIEESLSKYLDNIQTVYLPTYRRIEKDLKSIFPDLEEQFKEYEYRRRIKTREKESKSYVELVEFGMNDVKERLDKICNELRSLFYSNLSKCTGSYLEEILNKSYRSFNINDLNFDEEALLFLVRRLDENIITASGKESLINFVLTVNENGYADTEDRFNAFFVWKLFQVYELQKTAEKKVKDFVDVCNVYMSNGKRFSYDNVNFQVNIYFDNEYSQIDSQNINTLSLSDLSSGEKQIVSIFSHLLLSDKGYFLIIDEPELSLSVTWQERFLADISRSRGCNGFLAVTHSPFIFKNELKKLAHSLEEFKY